MAMTRRDAPGILLDVKHEVAGVRGAGGRFIERNDSLLRQINEHHALVLQAEVVENIQERTIRRAVSTGRLARVTASGNNIRADVFGFAVGIEKHLDSSTAKYWRQIEEGYAGHVGREIRGIWGGSVAGMYWSGGNLAAWPGGPFTPMGFAWRGGMRTEDAAGKQLTTGAGSRTLGKLLPYRGRAKFIRGVPVRTGTIEQPIEAQNSYEDAWARHRDEITASMLANARRTLMAAMAPRPTDQVISF